MDGPPSSSKGAATIAASDVVSEAVMRWRRRAKVRLLEEAGGACYLCGYDRCARALHFHHVDPSTKEYGIARGGITRAIEDLRAEASK